MDQEQVKEIIQYAIQQFRANDAELLDLDVSERAVMFHLGRYIREKTPADFDVDCEYNRHLTNRKQLSYFKEQLGIESSFAVLPDILIHHRNSDDQNILVVEIKKHGGNIEADVRKLEAFKKEPYSYNFAVQIVIGKPDCELGIDFEFV